ncbi:mechanosensitive ion channel family protein [Candidatus Dependentiae bacterium]|nr:mechanosensitive ion channel family protein [Candidatus Dependentiae bacterium]
MKTENFLSNIYLGIEVKDMLTAFIIIVLAFIISKIFRYILINKLAKLADFTETDFDNQLIQKLEKPLGNYIILFGISFSKTFIIFQNSFDTFATNTITSLMIINTAYLAISICGLFTKLLIPVVNKTKIKLDDDILSFIDKSIKIFIIIITSVIVIDNYFIFSEKTNTVVNKIFVMFITINVIYILFKMTDIFIKMMVPFVERTHSKLDDQLLPILSKIIKTSVIIVGVLTILKNLGYDVSALLAGLGIGGLAFALAAKDTLANFFGSIVVFTDQPFQIGDRITINNNDGVVLDVGLRSTKLKTAKGTEITIPNSEIANSSIENFSRKSSRKVVAKLGLDYSSSTQKIDEAIKIVKNILLQEEKTEKDFQVYFSDFGDFSLNISIIYWLNEEDFTKYSEILTVINQKIKNKLQEAGIEFAYPTQTLFVKKY